MHGTDLGNRASPIFFKPTNDFLDWMKDLSNGTGIIECGCGAGHLLKKLSEIGITILGIDLYPPQSPEFFSMAMECDATEYDFPQNTIAIMVRPNRGEWIHNTIHQAFKTVKFFIYVGLEKHYDQDIKPLLDIYNIGKVNFTSAGQGQEKVYVISEKGKKIDIPEPKQTNDPLIVPDAEFEELEPLEFLPEKIERAKKEDMPCIKCGHTTYYQIESWYCDNCHLKQLPNVDTTEEFDFSIREIDGEEYYHVASKDIKATTFHDYLPYRYSSGYDRVQYHDKILMEVGSTYESDGEAEVSRQNNWAFYFEKWIEEFLTTDEGHKTFLKVSAEECSKCGRTIALHDPRMNIPSGVVCFPCYNKTERRR